MYPSNNPRSFRTTELVKELRRQGHSVTLYIVKEFPEQDELANEYGFTLKNLGKPGLPDVPLNYKNKFLKLFFRGLNRLLDLLFVYPDIELMFLVNKALKVEKDYDLLISIAVPYPIHWGVALARQNKHRIAKTWVADCGDPFMGCKTDSFKKLFYFKYVEKWFCRKTDFISIPNKDHQSQYYPEFESKMRFIPQGFRFEDYSDSKVDVKNKIPTFAFAGVLLKQKRDPEKLLKYLASIDSDFKFILYTQSEKLIEPFKNALGSKIEVRPYIPREELIRKLSEMDFLVNIEFHSSVMSNSPSKLIDYAIVGRPILSLNMEKFESNKVDEFLKSNYESMLVQKNIEDFHIENVAKQFIQFTEHQNE